MATTTPFIQHLTSGGAKAQPKQSAVQYAQDPNKVVGYVDGKGYNYAGQFITNVNAATTSAPSGQAAPSGGDTGGSTPSGPTAAQVAEANRIAAARGAISANQDAIIGGGRQSAMDLASGYDTQSMDFASRIRTGQEDINTNRVNNALQLRRTISNIINGVRTGLRSAGVTLAGMNAADSGAADAAARAYAKIGGQQYGDASNQAALKTQQIDTDQVRLQRDREEGERRLSEYVPRETNRVRQDLAAKLTALMNEANAQGVGGVVNMGLVDQVLGEAMAQLAAIDGRRAGVVNSVQGLTMDEINRKAAEADAAGMPGSSPFDIPEGADLTQAGGDTGAPVSQVPIFLRRRTE